jgi:hypothetical protein
MIASFCIPGARLGLVFGFTLSLVGFAIGVSAGGGFGQTEGWGWGNIGALVLGISCSSAGFLAGVALFSMMNKKRLLVWHFLAQDYSFQYLQDSSLMLDLEY